MGKKEKISIIICTKDRPLEIKKLLKNINQQTVLPDEIIVVDASVDDKVKKIIPVNDKRVKYFRSEPNLTKQRNTGANKSNGGILFYFDDDVILDKDYIKNMIKVFNLYPDYIGGIGRIVNIRLKKNIISIIRIFIRKIFFLSDINGNGRYKLSGFPDLPYPKDKFMEVETIPGCCFALRRKIFKEFRFDENLVDDQTGYCYIDDDDFGYRVSRKYKFFYQPESKVVHYLTKRARDNSFVKKRLLIRNFHYFYLKNFPKTMKYRIVHYWTILGIILNLIIDLDLSGLIGTIKGLKNLNK